MGTGRVDSLLIGRRFGFCQEGRKRGFLHCPAATVHEGFAFTPALARRYDLYGEVGDGQFEMIFSSRATSGFKRAFIAGVLISSTTSAFEHPPQRAMTRTNSAAYSGASLMSAWRSSAISPLSRGAQRAPFLRRASPMAPLQESGSIAAPPRGGTRTGLWNPSSMAIRSGDLGWFPLHGIGGGFTGFPAAIHSWTSNNLLSRHRSLSGSSGKSPDSRDGGDSWWTSGTVTTATAPYEGMAMLIPVGRRRRDSPADLLPTLEAFPLQRQRA